MTDLWEDLDGLSRKPGPTMTITKGQFGALLNEIATLRAALDGLVEAAVPALAWMAEKCVPDGAEYAAEGHLFSLSIGELNDGEAIRDTLRAALATAKKAGR